MVGTVPGFVCIHPDILILPKDLQYQQASPSSLTFRWAPYIHTWLQHLISSSLPVLRPNSPRRPFEARKLSPYSSHPPQWIKSWMEAVCLLRPGSGKCPRAPDGGRRRLS